MKATTKPKAKRWQEYLPLDDLQPNPANPKDHVIEGIDGAMGRFGYIEPISIDERTGYLISGHGRRLSLLARRDAGTEPPEGVEVGDDGRWLVPVNRGWSSKDDGEARAALVALNRWVERGGWKRDELTDILESLSTSDDGLFGVGFESGDLNVMLAATGRTAQRESSFLDDLIGGDDVPQQPGTHTAGGEASVTLTLTFASREARDKATSALRRVAADSNVETMGDALLVLVDGVVGRVG